MSLQWNYIQPEQIGPKVNLSTPSLQGLASLGERLQNIGDYSQKVDAYRAAMANLDALQKASANRYQPTYTETPTTQPDGLANKIVDKPVMIPPIAGNGLARTKGNIPIGNAPTKAAEPFMPMFQSASKQYNVPLPVLLAVAQTESDFRPNLTSPTGVKGIMQVTQNTYNGLGFTGDRTDPTNSINAGAKLLNQLYNKYGNWDDAFYAYNGGHHGVTGVRQGNWGTWANNIDKQKEISNYATKVNKYLQAWNKLYG